METIKYRVPNISCGHCVHTIKLELGELAGVTSVEADQETQVVAVEYGPPAEPEAIRSLLVEINYPPVEVN